MLEEKKYIEGVSIVIVTYNGSDRLVETLQHLSKQEAIDFDIELILVDNNSTDNTSQKATDLWNKLGNPYLLRVVTELQPGTMHARKRGVEEAKYRYMLYCDDDNWLTSNYVKTAYNVISKDTTIAAVGGRGIIELDKAFKAPSWIAKYERSYGVGSQGKVSGDVTFTKGCLYTAGTIIDLKWLDTLYNLGFKSSLKGRDGKNLIAGEDTELTYALKLIGGKLYYNADMHFKHYMPEGRINWEYLKKLWWAFGYAEFVISPYNFHFNGEQQPNQFILKLNTLKQLTLLSLKRMIKGDKEGDFRTLNIMRLKGKLEATKKEKPSFIENIKLINKLKNS